MRQRRVIAAALALALTAACGARLDPKLREEAAATALGRTGSTQVEASGLRAASDEPATASAEAGGLSKQTGSATGAPGATRTDAGSIGAVAPATGNGGATDVGVTATTITVGNVADLSGPIPGLFQAAPYGVEAYFAYVNSQGGIFGRHLKLVGADSQTDCLANQNAYTNLMPKSFALVGSFSIYDDCGDKVLAQNRGVADLSYALGADAKRNTTNKFPPQVAPLGYQNGMFCHWAQKYGDRVKKAGSIYSNVPATVLNQKMIENAAKSCGWTFVSSIAVGATDTTFNAAINRMQQDGVQLIFIIATTAQNAAEMKREWDAQATGAARDAVWIVPIAYASDFIQRLGSVQEAEGITGHNLYSMFFSPDDAKNIPEVALFQQWMKRVHPGAALELYAMYAWAAAKLFVDNVKAVGPKLTRTAFIEQIRKVHAFDGGGIVNNSDIGAHQPSNCYLVWQIHNGAFERVDTPTDRFRCDGTFVPYNP